jgi:hypothetical protein
VNSDPGFTSKLDFPDSEKLCAFARDKHFDRDESEEIHEAAKVARWGEEKRFSRKAAEAQRKMKGTVGRTLLIPEA